MNNLNVTTTRGDRLIEARPPRCGTQTRHKWGIHPAITAARYTPCRSAQPARPAASAYRSLKTSPLDRPGGEALRRPFSVSKRGSEIQPKSKPCPHPGPILGADPGHRVEPMRHSATGATLPTLVVSSNCRHLQLTGHSSPVISSQRCLKTYHSASSKRVKTISVKTGRATAPGTIIARRQLSPGSTTTSTWNGAPMGRRMALSKY